MPRVAPVPAPTEPSATPSAAASHALAAFEDLRRLGPGAAGRFRELLGIDADVSRYLTSGELDSCFDLDHHLRHAPLILERALAESS